jgi:hypothetical protein
MTLFKPTAQILLRIGCINDPALRISVCALSQRTCGRVETQSVKENKKDRALKPLVDENG